MIISSEIEKDQDLRLNSMLNLENEAFQTDPALCRQLKARSKGKINIKVQIVGIRAPSAKNKARSVTLAKSVSL